MNEFKPYLVDPPSLVKPHGKNKFSEDFQMPKHDKYKLLGLVIPMGMRVKKRRRKGKGPSKKRRIL